MNAQPDRFDVIVVGAGIAGASVAAELSTDLHVLLLEREPHPGLHATGRSAAMYEPGYGPAVIRALTRASRAFFDNPCSPHIQHPLLTPRDVVFIARDYQTGTLDQMLHEIGQGLSPLPINEAHARMPLIREGYASAAVLNRMTADIDVDALHQHYLRSCRSNRASLVTRADVTALRRRGGDWQAETPQGTFRAPVVINAAGAWADQLAVMADAAPLGLTPKRRTAMIITWPQGPVPDDWPMVVDADEQFYLKPDAGKLLISPADATPSAPCDAHPDEMDIAICADRIQTAFDVEIRRIERSWAGLRSFLPDGNPVAGYDPEAEGFFWLAGQGGYGIQTAPALSRAAAALVRRTPLPADIKAEGVTAEALAVSRDSLRRPG
ncbi:FAD-binding oxidoreductase [Seohaeicola saemankumensis]|nr:FAD-dependent oxidoreductase [Seohaeicola saemankumensis]MCA0872996.1 FAD-binding oxidoreductase [Seohaeicola saemankumensis]